MYYTVLTVAMVPNEKLQSDANDEPLQTVATNLSTTPGAYYNQTGLSQLIAGILNF